MSSPHALISRALTLAEAFRANPVDATNRLIGRARAALIFRGAELGGSVCARGHVRFSSEGTVRMGPRVMFVDGMIPTELISHRGAELLIGESTLFNYGASIECFSRIEIGQRCMFASMVRVSDREGTRVAPIVIEDDVWIAHGAVIQPGVRIGAGSVVAAGSVVTQDVPARSMAVGNPARAMSLQLSSS